MKRFFALIIALIIMAVSLSGCASNKKEDIVIRIAGLRGPTSMGMAKLYDDNENGISKNKYEFTAAGSADEITPKLIKGEYDIAAVPANLAAVLYNNTDGAIQMLAINTLGVIYIVEKGDTVHSVEDLKGKTIVGSGKGSTPEYSLRHILEINGLNPDTDVNLEWKSEHTEVVQTLSQDENAIGLLPQPFVAVAQTQVDGLHIALDLTKEWEKSGDGSMMITGALVVRKDFAAQHKEEIAAFLEEYRNSINYVNSNPKEAAAMIEKFVGIKAVIAEKAIPKCNMVCISGEDAIAPLEGYLKVLYNAEPKSIGGKLPEKDFYYVN